MSRRIEVEGDDELADLGRTFNRMLDRLAIAFASQRDFIRDISHELRTPIAVVRGHLELFSADGPGEPTRARRTIRLVTGELDRMSRFVDDLLLLAKSDQPNFLTLETVRVTLFARSWCRRSAASRSATGGSTCPPGARSSPTRSG